MRQRTGWMRAGLIGVLGLGCLLVSRPAQAGEWLGEINATNAAAVTAAAREGLAAIVQRRSPKMPVSLNPLAKSRNGICLTLFKNGVLVASGESVEAELPVNIRQAANSAVYTVALDDLDRCPLFVSVLGEGKVLAPSSAPFYTMQPGAEAYSAVYRGERAFLGPLEPMVRGWGWKESLIELARKVVAQKNPSASRNELIQIAAAADFILTVYPATILVSPAREEQPLRFLAGKPEVQAVDAGVLKQMLLETHEWFRNNQRPDGSFPVRQNPMPDPVPAPLPAAPSVPVTAGKPAAAKKAAPVAASAEAGGAEDLTITAASAYGLGEMWRALNYQPARLTGLRTLDSLLINHFLEHPGKDFGYLKEKRGISLGSSALTLLAIKSLKAAENNPSVSKCAAGMLAFCQFQRNPDATFRPWFFPPDETEGGRVFPALAISALLDWEPEKNLRPMLESAERYRQQYANVAGAQPPGYAVSWLTGTGMRIYSATRKSVYADWVLGMNTALASDWMEKHRIFSDTRYAASDAALTLASLSEAIYLQKILSGQSGAEGKVRLGLYRRAALDATRTLLNLQVRPGAITLLFPEPRHFMGAFRNSQGELSCGLNDASFALIALSRAYSVLEADDFSAK